MPRASTNQTRWWVGILARFKTLSRAKQAATALGTASALAAVAWIVPQALTSIWDRFAEDNGAVYVYVERAPATPGGSTETDRIELGDATARLRTDPKGFDRGLPDWVAYSYVVATSAREVPPPPRGLCRDRKAWADSIGAVDAVFTRLQVTLEGRSGGAVVIDGIRAEVVARRAPLAGTWLMCPVGGAEASPRRIDLDLDSEPPKVQFLREGDEPVATPILFTLRRGEVETFLVRAVTSTCDCKWRVTFDLIASGERRTVTIDDDGQPFRTTATARAKPHVWQAGRWVRAERS